MLKGKCCSFSKILDVYVREPGRTKTILSHEKCDHFSLHFFCDLHIMPHLRSWQKQTRAWRVREKPAVNPIPTTEQTQGGTFFHRRKKGRKTFWGQKWPFSEEQAGDRIASFLAGIGRSINFKLSAAVVSFTDLLEQPITYFYSMNGEGGSFSRSSIYGTTLLRTFVLIRKEMIVGETNINVLSLELFSSYVCIPLTWLFLELSLQRAVESKNANKIWRYTSEEEYSWAEEYSKILDMRCRYRNARNCRPPFHAMTPSLESSGEERDKGKKKLHKRYVIAVLTTLGALLETYSFMRHTYYNKVK